ncbi:MAG: tetratricopeptide repeat protein [Candidatus Omnitrophica bacterium]|nr:tetratricopeptide repeat protein [Candidatus Omnitrophota bacterium]
MHDEHCGCEKHLKEGLVFLQSENWEKAKVCYEKALAIHEDNAVAWGNLGICFNNLDDDKRALECYNKALDYNPYHKHALVNKGSLLAKKKQLAEAIKCFQKALQADYQFETARDNLKKAIAELGVGQESPPDPWKIINESGKYFLKAKGELLRTPNGNIIEAKSPELLEAIISDLSDQGEIVIDQGILLSPRCISAYVLASSEIEFADNQEDLITSLPNWLKSDPMFLPTAGHSIVSIYQEERRAKVKAFFKERNILFKLIEQYNDSEWEKVVSVFQKIAANFTPSQKSALVNMAWPNDKQFVATIIYLLGLCDEREWAEMVFSRTADACRIIGEQPVGWMMSVVDESSDEEIQETINSMINDLEAEAKIVKRYLEISKRVE